MLYRSFLNGLIKINWTVFSKCAYPGPISRDSLRLGGVKCLFFLKNLLIVLPINTADSEHNYATSLAVQWLRPCFHYRGHRFLLVEALRSYKPFGQNRKKKRMPLPAEINYKIHLELKKKASKTLKKNIESREGCVSYQILNML